MSYCERAVPSSQPIKKTTQSTSKLVATLTQNAREELVRADNKAMQWLAGVMAIMVSFLGAVLSGQLKTADDLWPLPGIGAVLLVVAVALFSAVCFPRFGSINDGRVSHFKHVDLLPEPETVKNQLVWTLDNEETSEIHQLCDLSRITVVKYRLLKYGIVFTCLGITSLVLGVLTAIR